MIMLLYFSVIGGIFYKMFLTSPQEKIEKNNKIETIKSPVPTIVTSNAADVHGG